MRFTLYSFVALLLFACVGCGGNVGKLTGKVTRGGEPLFPAELTITSTSPDAQNAIFSGASIPSGEYNFDYYENGGAPLGKYKVRVSWHEDRKGALVTGDEAGMALIAEGKTVPKAVEFDAEIKRGDNALNFEVTEGEVVQLPKEDE